MQQSSTTIHRGTVQILIKKSETLLGQLSRVDLAQSVQESRRRMAQIINFS